MKSFNLKKIAAVTVLGLVTILGTSELANAQGNRNQQQRKISRQQERINQQRARIQQQRIRAQQQQSVAQQRQNGNRYRVLRNGAYYNTDQRGADLLRQAVNAGYQQGFQAARNDRRSNRRGSYSTSSGYRSGTYGYQSHVTQSQYQYYFRQGFQRGYQDGANTQYQDGYNGSYQYGTSNNGVVSILGSILGSILNIQSY